ncbi:MAG: multidrug efflux SMR transporter [Lachnospiraceae bacterium]|nr:multidrug efflux SMR transporter [Lachnospiraceae bacterium]
MAYLFLALAIGAEIVGTTLLKYSEGFSKVIPTIFSLLAYLVCHVSFSRAVTGINLGIAYAVWCGVGIIVTAAISRFIFGEMISPAGVMGIGLILAGCVVMNVLS